MAFTKPHVNNVKADIANTAIYIRSVKKWGKSTLYRNIVLAKYGDPECGLLVGVGNEIGYTMLDNLNVAHVNSWRDLLELKDWLINHKDEHKIKMIAFDTGDELALLAEAQTIADSNKENPTKRVKTINAAMNGFHAGQKYAANNLIKPYMTDLRNAGFGLFVLSHSKFKTIKEKGGLEEDGYMQLTSNLDSEYESAFGDIFDIVLTGVIDRDIETKESTVAGKKVTKRYATDEVRKLYFRGTTLIDAGTRFAADAVPEYMVFDKADMGAEFVRVIEEGMEKSKTLIGSQKKSVSPTAPATAPKIEVTHTEEEYEEDPEIAAMEAQEDMAEDLEADVENAQQDVDDEYPEDLRNVVKDMIKNADEEKKKEAKEIVKKFGTFKAVTDDGLKTLYDTLK